MARPWQHLEGALGGVGRAAIEPNVGGPKTAGAAEFGTERGNRVNAGIPVLVSLFPCRRPAALTSVLMWDRQDRGHESRAGDSQGARARIYRAGEGTHP